MTSSRPDKQKPGLVIVYTGDGKGKTTAGIGLIVRALGVGWRVAFVQFIKTWQVSENIFFDRIQEVYENKLMQFKGGRGFYDVGEFSAQDVSRSEHEQAAQQTLEVARQTISSGEYNLVVCDEINNAMHDGLVSTEEVRHLLTLRHENTSLCLTGRDFPDELKDQVDILTNMTKVKHHYDEGFIANRGIDF